ncbi:hypothetical protein VOLCADRAFT_87318 [Volvox carteri f. nagariensis]|uniref:Uncharacterized protein n=1 Tax=Volvox carteri f. nagariensis TaxID=3068 RepID=D8TL11_VOLCA|nr:uncharacterized protein VOLCADRAFT_87318 [Volvox carteri f. nagariensis]EFJ51793.1 hypothetical protein VOLCADRAFT_87318 [Volvox carteri f. nagariensis]|eukprot:XP_002947203.1 hypothetical protein VOLCADRAFT_87318 [Volvox carteri f. nagariensis]
MGNFVSTTGGAFTPSDAFFLCEATRTGSLDIVRLFLKKNPALVYATDASEKSTPWHVAAAAGHDVVVRVLIDTTRANSLSNNFDPVSKVINKQNAKGQTPLMLACGGGHSICVRLLLESGALLLVADATGRSALHYAALHCRADGKGNDCVELLLAHMQQQLIAQGPAAAPPQVHANVIRKFADTGDMYGRTALHCAAWSGNTRAAHALWAVGADICARTETDCYDAELPCNNGTTPLHFAAMRGHQPVVVLLLAAWHRMATRPGSPLPRPAFARALLQPLKLHDPASLPLPGLPSAAAEGHEGQVPAKEAEAQGEKDQQDQGPEAQTTSSAPGQAAGEMEPAEAQLHNKVDGLKQQQPHGDRKVDSEERGTDQDKVGENTSGQDGAKEFSAGAGTCGEQRQQEDASDGVPAAPAAGEDQRAANRTSAPQSGPASESGRADGGGDDSSSQSVKSMDVTRSAPALELPPPPEPRAPAMDPRVMVDAYGMTPYTIACKRKQERGSMLIELLDPATDFGGDETPSEGDDGDGDRGSGAEGDGGDGEAAARGSSDLLRYSGKAYGADPDGDDDDDADSDAAAAGPLLLWEGVELVRDIAANPDSFFKLQQTVSLLQPQLEDDKPGAGDGRGRSAAGISDSGSGSTLPIGRAANAPSRLPVTTTTEVVPDCFLCPLTCKGKKFRSQYAHLYTALYGLRLQIDARDRVPQSLAPLDP